jgi:hypothetical protein
VRRRRDVHRHHHRAPLKHFLLNGLRRDASAAPAESTGLLTVSLLAAAGLIAFSLPRRAREQASPVGAGELATDQAPELSAA